jgi:hypothetical protein
MAGFEYWFSSYGNMLCETCLDWFRALTNHYGLTTSKRYFSKHHEADNGSLGPESPRGGHPNRLVRLLQQGIKERPGYSAGIAPSRRRT